MADESLKDLCRRMRGLCDRLENSADFYDAETVRQATKQLWDKVVSREHILSPGCWCDPRQDDEEPTLWIHNDGIKRPASPSPCEHEWTDMRNQVIQSGELCRKCGLMRSSPQTDALTRNALSPFAAASPQTDEPK